MSEPVAIICMPADQPDACVRGVAFDHVCSRCATRVMIAQSSLRLIKSQPETEFLIVCLICFLMSAPDEMKVVPGPSQEQMAELAAGIVSNPWRRRN